MVGAGLLAVGAGVLMAGRVLRPLHRITGTARRIAESTEHRAGLHERINLVGPRDELHELADTFDAMLARLDDAFASQRRFVADASHELRTPLAIDRTVLEVALARPDASDDARQLATRLLGTTVRHERLLDGLLTLAHSDQGLAGRVPVDLAELAGHTLAQARPEATAAGIGLHDDLSPAPTTGDPVLLERVALNLLHNGIRHNSGPGGRVRIATRRVDGTAELCVDNTGPEVPPDTVPDLFEPFHRLSRASTGRDGAGLGLAIVRSVTAAHGGTVTAAALPEGGLVVRVRLPAGPPPG